MSLVFCPVNVFVLSTCYSLFSSAQTALIFFGMTCSPLSDWISHRYICLATCGIIVYFLLTPTPTSGKTTAALVALYYHGLTPDIHHPEPCFCPASPNLPCVCQNTHSSLQLILSPLTLARIHFRLRSLAAPPSHLHAHLHLPHSKS